MLKKLSLKLRHSCIKENNANNNNSNSLLLNAYKKEDKSPVMVLPLQPRQLLPILRITLRFSGAIE